MPFNPFSALTSKIFGGLSIVLLLALGVQTWRVDHYRAKADACATGRAADRTAYQLAQEAAKAKAIAAKLAAEASYSAKAKEADHVYQTALDRARAATERYAGLMRAKASGGSPSGAPAPAEGQPAPDRDGQGGATDLVGVTKNDLDILVANSVRLEAVRKWGETLVNEGLAAPDPAFGR